MKVYKIETTTNDNIRILIKKKEKLIAISVDKDNNIIADSFEDDLQALNEIAGLQTYMLKVEKELLNKENRSKNKTNEKGR